MNKELFQNGSYPNVFTGTPLACERELSASIARFVRRAKRYQTKSAESHQMIFDSPEIMTVPAEIIQCTTGTGKSHQMRQAAISLAIDAKEKNPKSPSPVLIFAPTQNLLEEQYNRLVHDIASSQDPKAASLTVIVWRGRDQTDLITGEPMCKNIEAVKKISAVGLSPATYLCDAASGRSAACPFATDCPHRIQRTSSASIVLMAHEMLFLPTPTCAASPRAIFIDETPELCGLSSDPGDLEEFSPNLCSSSQNTLKFADIPSFVTNLEEEGQSAYLPATKLLQEICQSTIGHEWMQRSRLEQILSSHNRKASESTDQCIRKNVLLLASLWDTQFLRPSRAERTSAKNLASALCNTNTKINHTIRRRAEIFRTRTHIHNLAATILAFQSGCEHFPISTRLARIAEYVSENKRRIKSGAKSAYKTDILYPEQSAIIKETVSFGQISITYASASDINPDYTLCPTLILSADASVELLKYRWPHIRLAMTIRAKTPFAEIVQITDRNWSKTSFCSSERTDKAKKRQIERLESISHRIMLTQNTTNALFISQKSITEIFRKRRESLNIQDGKQFHYAHFNALAGIDKWGPQENDPCSGIHAAIIVGRNLPPVNAVEQMARHLTRLHITPATTIPGQNQKRPWYQPTSYTAQTRSGKTRTIEHLSHPDPIAEKIRQAICEAEINQAIGRLRPTRRTAENPCTIYVLNNCPITDYSISDIISESHIGVGLYGTMATRNIVFHSGSDAHLAYPDLFSNAASATKALERDQKSIWASPSQRAKRDGLFHADNIRDARESGSVKAKSTATIPLVQDTTLVRHLPTGAVLVQYRKAGNGQKNRTAWIIPPTKTLRESETTILDFCLTQLTDVLGKIVHARILTVTIPDAMTPLHEAVIAPAPMVATENDNDAACETVVEMDQETATEFETLLQESEYPDKEDEAPKSQEIQSFWPSRPIMVKPSARPIFTDLSVSFLLTFDSSQMNRTNASQTETHQ